VKERYPGYHLMGVTGKAAQHGKGLRRVFRLREYLSLEKHECIRGNYDPGALYVRSDGVTFRAGVGQHQGGGIMTVIHFRGVARNDVHVQSQGFQ
jgi:hypothetical protein